jgi:hypothetical protein
MMMVVGVDHGRGIYSSTTLDGWRNLSRVTWTSLTFSLCSTTELVGVRKREWGCFLGGWCLGKCV